MTRRRTLLGVGCAIALVTSACGYHPASTVVQLANPGRCVPVAVAAAPDTAPLLADAAARFNGSAAARMGKSGCAFVQIENVDSPVALHELLGGWADSDRLGPAPVAWVPGSTMWGELLNARRAEQGRTPMASNGTPFARTPLVVAMPAPMARALGYPRRAIGWKDLAQLARDPRGWGAYGHPEWGPFRLGKGNPNWSTTGLDQTVALDASPAASAAAALEQSVVYYGDSPSTYLDAWQRLSLTSQTGALTYLSATVTSERSVLAYNTSHLQTDISLIGHTATPPLPLVAIYPKDASIESDNPIIVLDASWSSTAARAGARQFTNFALQSETQAEVAEAGFRPARGPAATELIDTANGVDPKPHTNSVAPTSPLAIEHALSQWQLLRKHARVLFLFDASASMSDPADPRKPSGPTKMAAAQKVLSGALDQLGPNDDFGLRMFTSEIKGSPSPDWRDIVRMGPIRTQRAALLAGIASLTPSQSSPLYAATHDAVAEVARHLDPHAINAVVVLTDGYNEDDHDTNQSALFKYLAANPNVRVFTITYSNDADRTTLRQIAQITNAQNYDARDTNDLPDLLPRAMASF